MVLNQKLTQFLVMYPRLYIRTAIFFIYINYLPLHTEFHANLFAGDSVYSKK